MIAPKSMVVGVDFAVETRAAVSECIRLAAKSGAAVHGVHVIDSEVAAQLKEVMGQDAGTIEAQLIEDARRAVVEFAGSVAGTAKLNVDVRIDRRVHGIIASCVDHQAELLVLGARSEEDRKRGFGATAIECARLSPCHVLLVRGSQPGVFRRVVACVDFSETSIEALSLAAMVASSDGAELHVLHVYSPPWAALHYRSPTPQLTQEFRTEYLNALRRRLEALVEPIERDVIQRKAKVELYEASSHRQGLLGYASSVGADLMVLGTHGRSNMRDMLLGSVAERVLRDSECSVLAVRPARVANREEEHPVVARMRMRPPG